MASHLTPLLLCEELPRGVHSKCCSILLRQNYLPISLIRLKVIQTGDHEIEIVNFANGTTIFLRDITRFNRVQVILKLYKDASSLKINLSKAKPYGSEHIKIELINQDKQNGHNFPIKYMKLFLVTLSSITSTRPK